jgi:hypothetical protein
MTATRKQHSTKRYTKRKEAAAQPKPAVLYVAFELSWNEWKLALGTGPLENPRLVMLVESGPTPKQKCSSNSDPPPQQLPVNWYTPKGPS